MNNGNGTRNVFTKCLEWNEPEKVRSLGLYPFFRRIEGTTGTQVICEGRRKIMIGSNNYLGLAQDERVLEASQEAIRKYGSGCTGSRFLNGNVAIHEQLERELASFLDRESVLLFSTGFFANLGALATLCDERDFILCDKENHASIIDGCKMTRAKTVPFAHNDMAALRKRLSRLPAEGGKLLVVDGVFSMSGDVTELPEIVKLAKEFGANIYVDEAHSLGVMGPNGEGVAHHFGLNKEVDLVMGTFSKSLGSMGGFVAGPSYIIEYLKHRARCFMFSAALAPAVSGGVLKALEIIRSEPELRENLFKNVKKMHEGFRQIGFNIGNTKTPVVPLLIGSEIKAFQFVQKLFEAGIFATPAVFPAVRYGQAIVRTSYMATHTDEELDYVLESCERIAKQLGVFQDVAYTGETRKRGNGGYDFTLYAEERAQAI